MGVLHKAQRGTVKLLTAITALVRRVRLGRDPRIEPIASSVDALRQLTGETPDDWHPELLRLQQGIDGDKFAHRGKLLRRRKDES